MSILNMGFTRHDIICLTCLLLLQSPEFKSAKVEEFQPSSLGIVLFSHIQLIVTPWTVACQAPLCPWDSPGKKTGMACRFLFQGIFPTQGLNPSLLLGRWILSHCTTGEALICIRLALIPPKLPRILSR